MEQESRRRLVAGLRDALGPKICAALEEPSVVEIMVNPDGRMFIERIGQGTGFEGELAPGAAELVIGKVAHALRTEVHEATPILSGELPLGGHRFEGLLPPAAPRPMFTIRKRASQLIPLETYVTTGVMTAAQARVIKDGIKRRLNIVISGGTGTGKTTLTNAIIGALVDIAPEHRLVILEDTAEIQCAADNHVLLHTTDTVDMTRLVKSTMRLRPDRIIVGEVRDGAALALLKAWNTGHPGGIATIHANSARGALTRLEQLVAEVSTQPMPEVIGEAVDLIVSIERIPSGRRVRDLLKVDGFKDGAYRLSSVGEPAYTSKGNLHVA
ncbi:P-type conjugative transfer ATPase TrbB [Devosia sp. Naph2]|uniref:P-type conjugative transfer ATPase TrbB n=1 Tax=Devosia polycyclovorans TaxID=3345148 RepID=UPI0035D10D91